MLPKNFEYFSPGSIQEATEMLSKYEESKILAGGQSLIPLMKLRLASPKYIVDINSMREFDYLRISEDSLQIGCLARHKYFETIDRKELLAFPDAARNIGDPQVRNLGTFCGSIVHSDPSADWTAVALAFNAEIIARSKNKRRSIKAEDFFLDAFTTSLERDEIVTEVSIKFVKDETFSSYQKLERKAGDFATAGSAVVLRIKDERCIEARVALTSVSNKPVRAKGVEDALLDRKITADILESAAKLASQNLNPPSDIRGSSNYRKAMAVVMTKRALILACKRGGIAL
jgi:carbon-monoxide dehydrogenase medium subunit